MKPITIACAALALSGGSAAAASSTTHHGGYHSVILNLDYSPKPLYDDDSVIAVTFGATRPARPGYEYAVDFSIAGKNAVAGVLAGTCEQFGFSWDARFGGTPSSHVRSAGGHIMVVTAGRESYWCRGTASLSIVEHRIGASAIGRYLGLSSQLTFRISSAP